MTNNTSGMRILQTVILGLSLLCITSCSHKEKENKLEKPNIVWVMLEDISHDFECYGMPAVKTPTFNALAEEGTLYYNCYGTASICSTNRSAMMVGAHQRLTNTHHHRSNREEPLASPFQPFTYLLKQQGYTNVLGHKNVMKKGRKIDVNFKHKPIGKWEEDYGLFDKFDEFTAEDQPFFAQIQLAVTHRGDWWTEVREQSEHPVNPAEVQLPPEYADHPAIRLDWAKYLDQVEYADNEMKMLIEELKAKGVYDNTVIIVIGDNGRCNIKGKGYLHDPGSRIPLIIKWPEGYEHDKESQQIIASTDITATILDIAGVELPDYLTGQSFIDENFDRKNVYSYRGLWDEIPEQVSSITGERFRYIRNDKPEIPYDAHQGYLEWYRPAVHVMRSLSEEGKLNEIQQRWFEPTKPQEELYDFINDPFETHNLANNPEYKDVLKQMRQETLEMDQQMSPVSKVYDPKIVPGLAPVNFVKEHYPKEYQRMLDGEEIGYKKYSKLYKKHLAKEKSKSVQSK
ncbi:sulfatase-like hydrolase/transferase [Flammeovirga yaeyamensis]|uniref:Sulfatase-like hydrolase/transferase n=2 Tax=Flammeovirga yaeyamensis TaxID=367791 RepID=A0AAX1NG01_9BACT|nr:sulfatase [Flammeovirga yaeyamensis]NMF33362.1 sulfatase [Flammeovirga yaeyamensis]QWG05363.1 sulfatase-like hydrolase/transferase [Flammeovirga yaeyamensis]